VGVAGVAGGELRGLGLLASPSLAVEKCDGDSVARRCCTIPLLTGTIYGENRAGFGVIDASEPPFTAFGEIGAATCGGGGCCGG